MNHIKYNDKWFNYYSSAKYTGKSILTGKNINVGDSIYWCVGTGGFLASEINLINTNTNNIKYHRGPVNSNWTYDDSFSPSHSNLQEFSYSFLPAHIAMETQGKYESLGFREEIYAALNAKYLSTLRKVLRQPE